MNREQFISAFQEKLEGNGVELSKSNINTVLNDFFELIIEKVSEEESIQFIKFGTFKIVHKKETKGRNPQTGAEITIAARKQPKFVPGSQFKDSVNGKAKPKSTKMTAAKASGAKKSSPAADKKKKA